MNITNLTTSQLRRILAIKQQIEALQGQIDSIAGGDGEVPAPATEKAIMKHRRSAAVRARMAASQRARWAKIKGTGERKSRSRLITAARAVIIAGKKGGAEAFKKKDRRSSPAARARLAAAAKARWAKARAEGKTTL
jgi:hypothetical protein